MKTIWICQFSWSSRACQSGLTWNTPHLIAALLLCLTSAPHVLGANFVYETPGEFLSSGDFNGDGLQDVMVLDKFSGNVRIGFSDSSGGITWLTPLVTGVQNPSGCAVGRLLQTARDAVAVTAPGANQIAIIDTSANAPVIVTPTGIGPHALAALRNPGGGNSPPAYNSLLAASSANNGSAELLDLMSINSGMATAAGEFPETGPFVQANELPLSTTTATFAAGIVQGTNDALHIWQFINVPGVMVSLSNLPPGSDYAFGTFNGESLPRFLFYQPGASNVTMYALLLSAGRYVFGAPVSIAFSEAVRGVAYLGLSGNAGSAQILFTDGVQALSFPSGVPALGPVYSSGAAGNLFTGLIPLSSGRFALLDAPTGCASSVHAQVLNFNGTTYTQKSSGNLPTTSARGTRANAWLFLVEPFVNRQPGFIKSLNAPDWTDSVSGLPGTISVSQETDQGPANGLGNTVTNNLGASPAGTQYGLPNQYRDAISLFSYSSPKAPDPVLPMISPPPGPYGGPIQIIFTNLHLGDQVAYRVGALDSWHPYAAPFPLTNDATIQFYGSNPGSPNRSSLQSAAYTFGRNTQPVPTLDFTDGTSTTNPPTAPPVTNLIQISAVGTVFYGRYSVVNNSTNYTIWAVGLDGASDTFVTTGARPRASRDGHYLAFLRGAYPVTAGNLWVRDLTTGQESLLFTSLSAIVGYDWDFTGTNLVFNYQCRLWKINLASHGIPTQLPLPSPDCYDAAPAITPPNGLIAYHNLSANANLNGIYLAAGDATYKQRLSFHVPGASWPEWSPDGQWLAFADDNTTAGALTADYGTNLWVVHSDGSGLNQITSLNDGTNRFPHGALWSPDSSALVGAGTIFDTNGLWLIPLTPDHTGCECPPTLIVSSTNDIIDFAGTILVAQPAGVSPQVYLRADTNGVTIYWSTNSNFALDYATNLASPISWQPVSNYILNGLNYEYHETPGALAARKFFRLRSQ